MGKVAPLSTISIADTDQLLGLLLEETHAATWVWYMDSGKFQPDDAWFQILGYDPHEPVTADTRRSLIHSEDLPSVERAIHEHCCGTCPRYESRFRARMGDGSWQWMRETGKVVALDTHGTPIRMIGMLQPAKVAQTNPQTRLLQAITRSQLEILEESEPVRVFEGLLQEILKLTNSEYGFIGEVFQSQDGTPYLKTHVFSDNSSNSETTRYIRNAPNGMEFRNLDSLIGAAIRTGEPVISNQPGMDGRSSGAPHGHPALRSFLGLPIIRHGKNMAMVGIANRPSGYDQQLIDDLDPMLVTVGAIIEGIHIKAARLEADRQLVAAKESAEAAGQTKANFLASMSHEIRTPMNGVMGMLTLMERTHLDPEQQKYLGMCQTSVKALLTVINDILDFSKIDAGKLRIEGLDFDIKALLTEITEAMTFRTSTRHLALSLDFPDTGDTRVRGDPGRIRQILMNLIGNAIKFTREGSIIIQARLVAAGEYRRLICSVQDTGVGIPEDQLEHIFDAFSQADEATTREYGGTGLGLAIVRQLCELMGGRVYAESRPGIGSVFTFEVELSQACEEIEVELEAVRASEVPSWPEATRVLIVEDNTINQVLIEELLEDLGLECDIANDGAEAVDKLREQGCEPYNLVLMDCQMPVLDGYQATRQIRAHETGGQQRVPIVAMTAHAVDGAREMCLNAGMDDYLSKPLDPLLLEEKLVHWLTGSDTGH